MTIEEQIEEYLAGLAGAKQADMRALHGAIHALAPEGKLWFLDGRNEVGKVVSNPNIGYGERTMRYADGSTREFYRVGLSGNTSGISVYVLGIEDKTFLATLFGERLGKASVTGYCIKFKALKDIDLNVLLEAFQIGFDL